MKAVPPQVDGQTQPEDMNAGEDVLSTEGVPELALNVVSIN